MKKVLGILGVALAAILALSSACGGGDDSSSATPSSTAATTATSATAMPSQMGGSPATKEELQTAFQTARASLQEMIAKANAGDKAATQAAYDPADDPIHMIEDAVRENGNASLADSIENKQHAGLEDPLKTGNPNLADIAAAAQEMLPLLDQAAAELGITAGATTAAELSAHLATLRSVMQDTIAKAQAGDVAGTQDAEGKGDVAMEALIKAVRAKDATLADKLETLELDYEGQADSANPDLTVIAQDAQKVLDLLGQVATTLNISEGTPASTAELTAHLATLRTVMQNTLAKAQAGDVQGTRDAEGEGDVAMEALIKAVRLKDATLADKLETLELDYEAQADSTTTDVTVIAQDAQKVLDLLAEVATTLNISP